MECRILTASDFGVPQNRRRAIFVGTLQRHFSFPSPTVIDKVTTSQAISDLPENTVADGTRYKSNADSDYQKWARYGSDAIYNQEATTHN